MEQSFYLNNFFDMIGSVTLRLPLNSYLKKYLTNKFGATYTASRDSWLGAYVIDVLDKEYRPTKTTLEKDDFYSITIPSSTVSGVGFSISKTKLCRLQTVLKKVFLNDLYSYIEVSKNNHLKVYDDKHDSIVKQNTIKAISQFLNYYEITEDDLCRESVYRQYYRYIKK
ncbi:MAG: hypothetical protein KGV59_01510 [Tenacibaculum sp.]|nr:hypothetical protein [Tenacibaculum sp.]